MKKLIIIGAFIIATVSTGCAVVEDGLNTGALSPRFGDVVMVEDNGGVLPDTSIAVVDAVEPVDVVAFDSGTSDANVPLPERHTYVMVLADTHVKEADGTAASNLRAISDDMDLMPWVFQGVFIAGDVYYQLPYTTIEEFRSDPADRVDTVEEIFSTFPVPVYPALGNHDMDDTGPIPLRDLAHQLFEEQFGVQPYYAVDLGTWKVLVLSNFEGPTHDVDDPGFDPDSGSMGAEQLAWMEAQVADGRPVVLITHFPAYNIKDLPAFMRAHKDTVRLLLSGHSHAWMNLSDNYGVPSMVVGTSQWDADCRMILELDNIDGTWRMVNWDKVHWGSGYALPWNAEL